MADRDGTVAADPDYLVACRPTSVKSLPIITAGFTKSSSRPPPSSGLIPS
ncbi:hypothetical protein I553_1022 [Mycobacterium xenopi 4042]|uniref:Uncharacterized protein n=1 Tax=Mycobacterium xenopi 4042 TaxID=1299334 RepID=X7Z956_MYCXE|nr:hypothetical protein I553_1022 [Mycobacterium xenopi 4042]